MRPRGVGATPREIWPTGDAEIGVMREFHQRIYPELPDCKRAMRLLTASPDPPLCEIIDKIERMLAPLGRNVYGNIKLKSRDSRKRWAPDSGKMRRLP